MSSLVWKPVDDQGEIVPERLYWPHKRRKPEDITIDGDLFALDDKKIDLILAVVASTGHTRFFYETVCYAAQSKYFARLTRSGAVAAHLYEKRMRAHFRKYKYAFVEGYTLPEPPTPELRAIYDSAASWEQRPTRPCGTTLRSGWSLGEYHWRDWPLSNLIDQNDPGVRK